MVVDEACSNDFPSRHILSWHPLSTLYVLSYGIMIYDYFLTMSLEVNLVWASNWSRSKALYLGTTYVGFLRMALQSYTIFRPCLSATAVARLDVIGTGLVVVMGIISELVLSFRTLSIWERSRRVGMGLIVGFSLLVSSCLVLVYICLKEEKIDKLTPSRVGVLYLAGCILSMTYDSSMLSLNLYKAKQHCVLANFSDIPVDYNQTQLASVLFRDGILYYVYIIGLTFSNIPVIIVKNVSLVANLLQIQMTLRSVLTKQMFLNLRTVASSQVETWMPGRGLTLPTISFAPRDEAPNSHFGTVSGRMAGRDEISTQHGLEGEGAIEEII
ncbi:hypothetical protein K439DRAFT_1665950 [Ramaria rubella]|nr:hypothetical protein K439DRAFT_1665950 [Ramaria rubella]